MDSLIDDRRRDSRFADPAIGTGSFFSAALAVFGSKRIRSAVGVELDPAFYEAARDLWSDTVPDVVRGDFTRVVSNTCRSIRLFSSAGHGLEEDGGYAAWLVPSEFMDVNYGAALKRYLTDRVTLIRAHRFDPDDVQFGDALVSSVVLVFRKTPPRQATRPSSHSSEP